MKQVAGELPEAGTLESAANEIRYLKSELLNHGAGVRAEPLEAAVSAKTSGR